MKRAIIANPAAGKTNKDQKKVMLDKAAQILQCSYQGLDTNSAREFCECAQDLAQKVDQLIVAGGDGSLLDVINSVDSEVSLGYLGLGSGNGIANALGLPRSPIKGAYALKQGEEHYLDLIQYNHSKKTLSVEIGFNAFVSKERKKQPKKAGFYAYVWSTVSSLAKYKRTQAKVRVDGKSITIPGMLLFSVTKHPYYGYGLKVAPEAKLDDGKLYLLSITSGVGGIAYGLMEAATTGNSIGLHKAGKEIKLLTQNKRTVGLQGTPYGKGNQFELKVLPKKLRMVY